MHLMWTESRNHVAALQDTSTQIVEHSRLHPSASPINAPFMWAQRCQLVPAILQVVTMFVWQGLKVSAYLDPRPSLVAPLALRYRSQYLTSI